ncbi:MAG: hypothetical protein LC808_33675, partial [Actinobacteria bacterium]|nr:hypothetical protein [Actinomycetota bacterium]
MRRAPGGSPRRFAALLFGLVAVAALVLAGGDTAGAASARAASSVSKAEALRQLALVRASIDDT